RPTQLIVKVIGVGRGVAIAICSGELIPVRVVCGRGYMAQRVGDLLHVAKLVDSRSRNNVAVLSFICRATPCRWCRAPRTASLRRVTSCQPPIGIEYRTRDVAE